MPSRTACKGWRSRATSGAGAPAASIASMAAISVRDLDDDVRELLRRRAADNGRSMEAEVREILTAAVREPGSGEDFFVTWMERFNRLGGVDLDLPVRAETARVLDLEW